MDCQERQAPYKGRDMATNGTCCFWFFLYFLPLFLMIAFDFEPHAFVPFVLSLVLFYRDLPRFVYVPFAGGDNVSMWYIAPCGNDNIAFKVTKNIKQIFHRPVTGTILAFNARLRHLCNNQKRSLLLCKHDHFAIQFKTNFR